MGDNTLRSHESGGHEHVGGGAFNRSEGNKLGFEGRRPALSEPRSGERSSGMISSSPPSSHLSLQNETRMKVKEDGFGQGVNRCSKNSTKG